MVTHNPWSSAAAATLLSLPSANLLAQSSWSQTQTQGNGPALAYHGAAYDMQRQRMVMFGGFDPSFTATEEPGDDLVAPDGASALAVASGDAVNVLSWMHPIEPGPFTIVIRYTTDGDFPAHPADGLPLTEIVKRVKAVGLATIVNHRQLIVPQLGAPGVAAHAVEDLEGHAVLVVEALAPVALGIHVESDAQPVGAAEHFVRVGAQSGFEPGTIQALCSAHASARNGIELLVRIRRARHRRSPVR